MSLLTVFDGPETCRVTKSKTKTILSSYISISFHKANLECASQHVFNRYLSGCGQISAVRCPYDVPNLIPIHRCDGIFFNDTQLQLFIRVSGNWTQVVKHIPSLLRDKYLRCDLIKSFFPFFYYVVCFWAMKNSVQTHWKWYNFCSVWMFLIKCGHYTHIWITF